MIFDFFIRVLVDELDFVKSSHTTGSEHNVWWNIENFIIKIWDLIDDKIEDLKIFWLICPDSGGAIAPGLISWCLIVRKISDQEISIWLKQLFALFYDSSKLIKRCNEGCQTKTDNNSIHFLVQGEVFIENISAFELKLIL